MSDDPLDLVVVPEGYEPLFRAAADYVRAYFARRTEDPVRGSIRIGDERYLMLRTGSLSVEFFDVVKRLYEDDARSEHAEAVARSLLYDVAHALGIADARDFHERMGLDDPVQQLSAGPVHFALAGWARVHILEDSSPEPTDDFVLVYDHEHTFEAEAWRSRDRHSDHPVCVMNAGYSSGWCEASFDMPLAATELVCEAAGDPCCRFVMAPPDQLSDRVEAYLDAHPDLARHREHLDVPGFFAAQRDAERALHESQARFRQAFEHAAGGMAILDVDGRYLEVNQAFAELFGYAPDEIEGRHMDLHADADERARTRAYMGAVLAGELPAARFDAIGRTKQGALVHATLSSTVVRDADGTPLSFLLQVQDRTEEHRARSELAEVDTRVRQSQKLEAIGRLAGGVAHDFNNLLTVVLAAAEQLEAEDVSDRGRRSVQAIQRAATRAGSLTQQLLAFGRKQVLMPTALDLAQVVRDVHELLARLIGEDVELRVDIEDGPHLVRADPSQLEQVVANLAVNARDAMPGGGVLGLRVYALADGNPDAPGDRRPHVGLEVRDTGAGMTPEVVERLFEPYYTTKAHGTGLGMAVVYGIVQQSGGTIRVHTEPGVGTRFVIAFPSTDERPEVRSVPEVPVAGGGHETILIAEDDADIREMVCEALELLGYDVLAAADGEEAVALAADPELSLDLLVTDIVMPRCSGPTAAARIREHRPGLPVVFMTGYADDDRRRGPLPAGAPVLRKPFALKTLNAQIRALLTA